MLISSKVSHSVLTFLESKGAPADQLTECVDLPLEFARDPSCWIQAAQMERFLATMEEHFAEFAIDGGSLAESVGKSCSQLKAWGVLDSVVKMMESSRDLLAQPERFLSYFVSPPPPVGSLRKDGQSIRFETPISEEEYPHFTRFLKGTFVGLPSFFGGEPAAAEWVGTQVSIFWSTDQKSLFVDVDPGRNMSPEFMQQLVASLEKHQRELEDKNRELLEKNRQLEQAQKELQSKVYDNAVEKRTEGLSPIMEGLSVEIGQPVSFVRGNLHRLQDYLVRAQQLVTLLVKQDRMDRQVQSAMKRVDWDFITQEFPKVVGDSTEGLLRIQEIIGDLKDFVRTGEDHKAQKRETDLNQVVERAIKSVQPRLSEQVRMDRHLLLDRTIAVDPVKMEQALKSFIENAVDSIEDGGSVRVVTRPNGSRAEIEISDTGAGMDEDALENVFTPFYSVRQRGKKSGLGLSIARSIVKMHEGNVVVSSELGRGSTFLIDLPS